MVVCKAIGAILFLLGGVALGVSVEKKYKSRVELWKEISAFLSLCQSEINSFGASIEEIVKKTRERRNEYSDMIADCIRNNTTGSEEERILTTFIEEIKSVDSETQKTVFDRYREEIDKKIAQAEENYQKKGKAYQRLIPILCAGIVVVIW